MQSLFGREDELGTLCEAADDARAGRGALVLVTGDAGVGKTALCEALAEEAAAAGMTVVRARCWDGGGSPAYWPWRQALRAWARTAPDGPPVAVGPGGPALLRLVPELAGRIDTEPGETPLARDGERFALFDAVARLLEGAADLCPLVVLLDDVHAADASSLGMLRMVARDLPAMRVLVVATYREAEAVMDAEVADSLGAVAGEGRRIELSGLGRPAAAALIREMTGASPDEPMLDALLDATDGNPLYLAELCRLLARQGRLTATAVRRGGIVPATVRAVVSKRLDVLSDEHRRTLRTAAAVGRAWDVRSVTALVGGDRGLVRTTIAEAHRAGLVETPSDAATAAFSHAIVRDALYHEISPGDRPELHRRIAETLLELPGKRLEEHLAEIAHHLLAAEDPRGPAYAIRAGEHADRMLAHEDAAEHYARALAALEADDRPDPARRCHALLLLGAAQWRASLQSEAKRTFFRAADAAEAAGLPDQLARAALGFGGRYGWVEASGEPDEPLLALLERAADAAPTGDTPLKAELMGRLAMLLSFSDAEADRRDRLSRDAVAMARRTGDEAALAYTLNARRFVLWHQPPTADRPAVAAELLRLARANGEPELAMRGLAWRVIDLLERGDAGGAAAAAAEHARLADRLRQPLFLAEAVKLRAMLALMRGELAEAERLVGELAAAAERAVSPDVHQALAIHMFVLRYLQGRIDELADGIAAMADRLPRLGSWRAALAFAHVTLGRHDAAQAEYDRLAAEGFAIGEQAGSRAVGFALLGEVVAALGDASAAGMLADGLAPYEGTCIVVGYGAALFGPASWPLGRLDALTGDLDRAERRLRSAVEVADGMRARPWATAARADLARVLGRRDRDGDREEAAQLVGAAARAADAMGAHGVAARAAAAAAELALESDVTLLFTDIVDSTATAGRVGDRPWLDLLRRHNAVVRHAIRAHGGEEVKTIGDGFMIAFPDPRRAARCAAAIQRELAGWEGVRLGVRIGIHAGAALREDGDWLGAHVHYAARVMAQARAGEVLVSEAAAARAGEVPLRGERRAFLKGFDAEQRLLELDWRRLAG